MINVDLQQLIQALDADTRRDLEGSAERCVARGGSKVLVEDLLLGLLERPQGLLARALQDAAVDAGELNAALQARGEHSASRNPVFAPELVQWLQDALLLANLELGRSQIDQAALILALLRNPLRYAGSRYQPLLARLDIERLKDFAPRSRWRARPAASRAAASPCCSVSPTTLPSRRATASSIRCSVATGLFARWSTSWPVGGKTTPSWSARPASARPPSSKAWPRGSPQEVPPALRDVELLSSTWACCRPVPA